MEKTIIKANLIGKVSLDKSKDGYRDKKQDEYDDKGRCVIEINGVSKEITLYKSYNGEPGIEFVDGYYDLKQLNIEVKYPDEMYLQFSELLEKREERIKAKEILIKRNKYDYWENLLKEIQTKHPTAKINKTFEEYCEDRYYSPLSIRIEKYDVHIEMENGAYKVTEGYSSVRGRLPKDKEGMWKAIEKRIEDSKNKSVARKEKAAQIEQQRIEKIEDDEFMEKNFKNIEIYEYGSIRYTINKKVKVMVTRTWEKRERLLKIQGIEGNLTVEQIKQIIEMVK